MLFMSRGIIEHFSKYFFSVLGRKKNKLGEDGILRSARPDEYVELKPVSNGSFYIELLKLLNKRLKEKGDWIWLKNALTQDILMASNVEKLTKR